MDPMLDACRRGDVAALQRAASFGPLDLSREDECGRTALHWAADGGHVDVAIALIKMGAHVDAVDDDGQTALHYAATCERAETCRLLLESGADPDLPDADGDTPSALGAVGLAMRSPGAD
jgi:ankyrin repeat protein